MEGIGLLPLVRRWWWLLALGAVLAGVVAYAVASRAAPTYRSDTKVLVGPISAEYTLLRSSGQLGRTYAELAMSRPVLRSAADAAGVRMDAEQLEESVRATSNEITRVVTIAVEHGDAVTAARLANAIAEHLKTLAAQEPAENVAALDDLSHTAEVERLSVEDRDAVIEAARRVLGQSIAGRINVIDPAEPPLEPVAPRVSLITVFAAFAGLLIVGVLVVLRESTVHGRADERSLVEIETPAYLGAVEASAGGSGAALATDGGMRSAVAEQYRVIAAKTGFLEDIPPIRSLLIVDAGAGRSSGVVAANLAAVLAESGRRVLLVDADTMNGSASRMLGVEGQPGYGELLTTLRTNQLNGQLDKLRIPHGDALEVLPRGASEASGLLDVEHAYRLLDHMLSTVDLVLITAPPIQRSPAALVWSRVAEGTIVVVDRRTSQDHVGEAIRSLSFVDANLIGTVLGETRRLMIPARLPLARKA